jgi:predicted DNA-binding protein
LNSYIEKTFEEFKELYLQQPVQKRVKRRSKSQEVSPEFQESVLEEGENTKKPKSKELSEL